MTSRRDMIIADAEYMYIDRVFEKYIYELTEIMIQYTSILQIMKDEGIKDILVCTELNNIHQEVEQLLFELNNHGLLVKNKGSDFISAVVSIDKIVY